LPARAGLPWARGPARVLGLDAGTLASGALADVVLIDPTLCWTVDPDRFHSRGRNTPFAGKSLRGKVVTTIVGGEVRYVLQ